MFIVWILKKIDRIITAPHLIRDWIQLMWYWWNRNNETLCKYCIYLISKDTACESLKWGGALVLWLTEANLTPCTSTPKCPIRIVMNSQRWEVNISTTELFLRWIQNRVIIVGIMHIFLTKQWWFTGTMPDLDIHTTAFSPAKSKACNVVGMNGQQDSKSYHIYWCKTTNICGHYWIKCSTVDWQQCTSEIFSFTVISIDTHKKSCNFLGFWLKDGIQKHLSERTLNP